MYKFYSIFSVPNLFKCDVIESTLTVSNLVELLYICLCVCVLTVQPRNIHRITLYEYKLSETIWVIKSK